MFRKLNFSTVVLLFILLITSALSAKANLEPVFLKDPPSTVFPRSGKPAPLMYLFDTLKCDRHTKTLIATAQGIINRNTPQLYLVLTGAKIKPLNEALNNYESINMDIAWMDWLVENDYLGSIKRLNSVEELFSQFNLKKVVLVDPDFPATLNIGCMVAAVEGAAVAYPEHVEKYNLDVIQDLRGRWRTNAEAYQWAFENLWKEMDQSVIACITPAINAHLRDYLVGKKIFTLWMSNPESKNPYASKNELDIMKGILAKMPVNIPVLGYPSFGGSEQGLGEGPGVKTLSDYGKYLVPTDWRTNLSVWTGLEAKTKEFKQLPPRDIKLKDNKTYATFLISDGDNMNMWLDFVPGRKYWNSPLRGKIPLAWSIGPGMIDMQAPLLDYYYSSLTPMDSFGCAVSGIGYMYPHDYGSAYGDNQGKVLDGYINITNKYMKKLDLTWIWTTIIGEHAGENLQKFTSKLDNLEVLFEGYGRQWWRDEPYTVNDVPIFHFVNDAVSPEQSLKETLRNVPKDKPSFVVIFIQNWPFTLQKIDEMRQALGSEYEFVRPDELAKLYKDHKAKESQSSETENQD